MSTRRTGARLRRSILLAAVLALLLAACSNSSDTKPTAAASGGEQWRGCVEQRHDDARGAERCSGCDRHRDRLLVLGHELEQPAGHVRARLLRRRHQGVLRLPQQQGGIYGRKLVLSKSVDDELSNNQAEGARDHVGQRHLRHLQRRPDRQRLGRPGERTASRPTPGRSTRRRRPGIRRSTATARSTASTARRRPARTPSKTAGGKRIATLGYGVSENSKECADSTAESVEKYSTDIGGAQAVYTNDDLDFGLPNGIGPEVTAMKQANVDVIYAPASTSTA